MTGRSFNTVTAAPFVSAVAMSQINKVCAPPVSLTGCSPCCRLQSNQAHPVSYGLCAQVGYIGRDSTDAHYLQGNALAPCCCHLVLSTTSRDTRCARKKKHNQPYISMLSSTDGGYAHIMSLSPEILLVLLLCINVAVPMNGFLLLCWAFAAPYCDLTTIMHSRRTPHPKLHPSLSNNKS